LHELRLARQGKLHSQIENDYHCVCPSCGGFINEFKGITLDDQVTSIAEAIYNGTFTGDIAPDMTKLVAEKLLDAMFEGYGKNLSDMEYGDPDWKMIENLQRNVYHFSGAKNYQQLKTMTLALKDSEGNIVSLSDFKQIALQINNQYNLDWLSAEYDTAVGSAQMAGKWVGFEDDAILEYSTAGDERVRESHALLDGIIKPKNDAFWNKYYPPNGYRCRCNVIESTSTKVTPDSAIQKPPVPEMWQTNTAKAGLLFPKTHPYYKGVPKSVLKEAEALLEKLTKP
jgi:SPP1 gp7 family putative phage head morphogenesis protein